MKRICIIGASSGLGLRLTVDCLGEGQQVYGTYHSDPRALLGLQKKFTLLKMQQLNLMNTDDLHYPDECCDSLILFAGEIRNQLFLKETTSDFQKQLAVNLTAQFELCQKMYQLLRKSDNPHIIMISSGSAIHGNLGQTAYSASKAGILGLGKSLTKEWARANIKVNIILPGFLRSRQTLRMDPSIADRYLKMNVLGRTNTLAEVSRFIRHLITTKNISGQVFSLDSQIVV